MMTTDEILDWQHWVRVRAGAAADMAKAYGDVMDLLGWPTPWQRIRKDSSG